MPYQQPDYRCDHRKYNADDQHINGGNHLGHCQKSHKNNRKHNDDDGDHRAWYPVVSSSPSTHLLAPFLFLLSLRAAAYFIASPIKSISYILYADNWKIKLNSVIIRKIYKIFYENVITSRTRTGI